MTATASKTGTRTAAHSTLPDPSSLKPGVIFDLIAQLVIALGMAPVTSSYHYLNSISHVIGKLERLNPIEALGPYAIEVNLEGGNFFVGMAFVRSKYANLGVFSSRESDWNHMPQVERESFLRHLTDAISAAGAVPDFEEVGAWSRA